MILMYCPACEWKGEPEDIRYHSINGCECCTEPVCPECLRPWPIDLSVHSIPEKEEVPNGT